MKRYKIKRVVEEGSNEIWFDIVDSLNNETVSIISLLDSDGSGYNYGLLAAIEERDYFENSGIQKRQNVWQDLWTKESSHADYLQS